jgi:hypothetical protein
MPRRGRPGLAEDVDGDTAGIGPQLAVAAMRAPPPTTRGPAGRPESHPLSEKKESAAMTDGRCIHDFVQDQCALCRPRASGIDFGQGGNRSNSLRDDAPLKQESLDRLCRLLSLGPLSIGVGSSVPSEVFEELVRRFDVPHGSMPEIAEAVAQEAGVSWDASCDSRSSISGGGSTVTATGLARLVRAVERLL